MNATTAPDATEFQPFTKIARLFRPAVITEKIDGTNAQVLITESGDIRAGSRNRWLTPQDDNYGFARWVEGNKADLLKLGPGRHFGEWWGSGIQRGYGLKNGDKRFSLFNVHRWVLHNDLPSVGQSLLPECVGVVPVIRRMDPFCTNAIDATLGWLKERGSFAAPGYMQPEGIVVLHEHSRQLFKVTLDNNDGHKGENKV